MEFLKNDINELTYKTKNRLREKDLIVDGGEIDWEVGTAYLKQITNKDLLYSIGNSAQSFIIT